MARSSLVARGRVLAWLTGLVVVGVGSPASANPAVEACAGKREGEACGLMKLQKPADGGELQRSTVPGVCRADECCDLDYSKGSPPETVCHACLACKEGPADAATPPADGKAQGGSANGEPPRTEGGPPPTAPAEQRGCAIGRSGSAPRWAWLGIPWLAAVAVRRRRRRRPG